MWMMTIMRMRMMMRWCEWVWEDKRIRLRMRIRMRMRMRIRGWTVCQLVLMRESGIGLEYKWGSGKEEIKNLVHINLKGMFTGASHSSPYTLNIFSAIRIINSNGTSTQLNHRLLDSSFIFKHKNVFKFLLSFEI